MFRGRRHVACNMDPGNVAGEDGEEEAMDIKPLEAAAYVPPDGDAPVGMSVDPMMVWKADVLRALRGAEDRTMDISALFSQAPNPNPGIEYSQLVQEHLVNRLLVKWTVENETVQLLGA